MTLAAKWKAERLPDYPSVGIYLKMIEDIDPKAQLKRDDLGVVVIFSDGSLYRMDT